MTIKLPADVARFIRNRLASGGYRSADEVLRSAVGALEQAEASVAFAPGELDALIDEGERSIREHGVLSHAQVFGGLRKLSSERRRRRRSG